VTDLLDLAQARHPAESLASTAVDREMDRQVGVLLEHGIPELLALPRDQFTQSVRELRPVLQRSVAARGGATPADGRVPFILVASGGPDQDMIGAEQQILLLRLPDGSAAGVLDRNHGPEGLAPYRPIDMVGPPPGPVYALLDVDRGEEFRGVPPRDALPTIQARGRSPLTILEGIAAVLLHPHLLAKNACFMLSGSRRGDRRVPALWISKKAPKLGWCWDGNPHTWLGVASTAGRIPQPDSANA